ncbi:MAG: hypothetical protein K2X77_06825 [Candidatus Obscuribacterales bacterium]|nr:hypothetical protein [Candidatus Obscuribacterales bacterium]
MSKQLEELSENQLRQSVGQQKEEHSTASEKLLSEITRDDWRTLVNDNQHSFKANAHSTQRLVKRQVLPQVLFTCIEWDKNEKTDRLSPAHLLGLKAKDQQAAKPGIHKSMEQNAVLAKSDERSAKPVVVPQTHGRSKQGQESTALKETAFIANHNQAQTTKRKQALFLETFSSPNLWANSTNTHQTPTKAH